MFSAMITDNANGQGVLRKYPAVRNILHVSGIQRGDFTQLCNVKGPTTEKVSQVHNICHRRLMETRDSPNQMEDVC